MNSWKTCEHKFVAVKQEHFDDCFAWRDECTKCGCIGTLATKPNANGFYEIVAQPMATVLDFNEFKKRKEQQDGKSTGQSNIGG